MVKNRHYQLRNSLFVWCFSLVIFAGTLVIVGLLWKYTMRNGEPGISSMMLLADRNQISRNFCRKVLFGYGLLGMIAIVGYIGYWLCHYVPFLPPKLNTTATKYRRFCLSTYVSFALWYIQHTFTVGERYAQLYHWGLRIVALVSGISAIFFILQAFKNRKASIEKIRNDIDTSTVRIRVRGSKYRDLSTALYFCVTVFPLFRVILEFCDQFFLAHLLRQFINRFFVEIPFVMNTPYDFMMAIIPPLLFALLLVTNLYLNAPPKIGIPYRYATKGIHIFTLANNCAKEGSHV